MPEKTYDTYLCLLFTYVSYLHTVNKRHSCRVKVHAINSQVTSDKLLDSPFNFPLCVCQSKRELEIASGDT